MSTFTHIAVSVDIDRFSDAQLRRELRGGWLTHEGAPVTPGQLRKLCAEARAQGLRVFPPCNHTHRDGKCAGHATGPGRVQRKRTKGSRLPEGAVYVGRGSRWGNPYKLERYKFAHLDGSPAPFDEAEAREMSLRDYEAAIVVGMLPFTADDVRRELRGKLLACWCPLTKRCHSEVLLEIANGGDL